MGVEAEVHRTGFPSFLNLTLTQEWPQVQNQIHTHDPVSTMRSAASAATLGLDLGCLASLQVVLSSGLEIHKRRLP